jgi:DNA recombination protein RmuC
MEQSVVVALLAGLVLGAGLAGVWLAVRRRDRAAEAGRLDERLARLDERLDAVAGRLAGLGEASERAERGLREEQRASRAELAESLGRRFDGFEQRLGQSLERLDRAMEALRQHQAAESTRSREALEARLGELRLTLESRLVELQQGNEAKLEQMRATVDEKLHATLETRLGESFKLVSERLEQVHAGLGEMRSLAVGVGDLKRVLGNVKTRGVLGEAQLAAILDELLTVEQYAANVPTRPGSTERVEFAVKLPGPGEAPVWLPIDAKFPREDYERLLEAQERADTEAAAAAGQALEQRLRLEARKIAEKYIAPPHSTDFAVLFLPTEGLYAEVLRRPGLFEALQREQRVVIAGPTTLAALLNSLRMGFRTLAIEKRSSEVWQVLGAVRTEFGKFGAVLDAVQKQVATVGNTLEKAGVRTRALERKLRDVEALDADTTRRLLGDIAGMEGAVDAEDGP